MKTFFVIILGALLALSFIAYKMRPARVEDGRLLLSYACPDFWAKHEQVALFNSLNPDVRVNIDPSDTAMQKVIVQCLAGVGPDLFNAYVAHQSSAYINAGIAWDVTDELAAAGVNVARDTWPTTHSYVIRNDRVYGFPYAAHADAMYYNKDIFDAHKIPYPTGVMERDAFLDLAKRLTVRDAHGRITQYGFLFSWSHTWRDLIGQWGGRIYNDTGTRCEINSPESVAATQFLHDLVWEHHVSPTPEQESGMTTSGGWGSGTVTWFGASRAAMAVGGRYWLVAFRQKDQYPNLRLGVLEYQFGPHRAYQGYAGCVMINSRSPRRKEALRYLTFMAGPEYNALVNSQADGLGPMRAAAETEDFLHNPEHPEEDQNEVWQRVLATSFPYEYSPFVDGSVESRIIDCQLDLVRNNSKSVSAALDTIAAEINEAIDKAIARDKRLARLYAQLTRNEVAP